MAQNTVQEIIRKAVIDENFRGVLLNDIDTALASYDLTAEEIAGLRKLNSEVFAEESGTLEERVSRGLKLT